MIQIAQRAKELVEEKIADRPELFLVDVKMLPNNKLIIQVDGDEGITIADCAAISRHVGFHLEEENVMEKAYNLEVSSPGVGEPLKLKRQYIKNTGRDLGIRLTNGVSIEGKLAIVSDSGILIEPKVKPGKKNKEEVLPAGEIAFEDITEAKVLISFK